MHGRSGRHLTSRGDRPRLPCRGCSSCYGWCWGMAALIRTADAMYDVDKILARAQVGLAFLFAIGFFGLLFALLLFHRDMSATELTILTGLVSVLGTLLALMMNFFFARTRPAALPDPTTTTTSTQST